MSSHVCSFCKKRFKRESTLLKHECEPKRRYQLQDSEQVRLAHRLFNQFQLFSKHKPVIKEDFLTSYYFKPFERFALFLIGKKCFAPEEYLTFCLKNQYLMRAWFNHELYDHFIKVQVMFEDPETGIHRTLKTILQYSDSTKDFFETIPCTLAASWIKDGDISPWVFKIMRSSKALSDRWTELDLIDINEYLIDRHWDLRAKKFKDEITEIQRMLQEHNLG